MELDLQMTFRAQNRQKVQFNSMLLHDITMYDSNIMHDSMILAESTIFIL